MMKISRCEFQINCNSRINAFQDRGRARKCLSVYVRKREGERKREGGRKIRTGRKSVFKTTDSHEKRLRKRMEQKKA